MRIHRLDVEQSRARRTVGEQANHFRRFDQQIRHVGRGSEHDHQPLRDGAFVAECAQEPGLIDCGLGQPAVVEQTGIGVGGIGEPFEQGRQQYRLDLPPPGTSADQGPKVPEGILGRCEAECGELAFGGIRRQPHGVGIEAHHRIEQRSIEQLRVQTANALGVAFDFGVQHTQCVAVAVGTHVRGPRQPAQRFFVVRRRKGVRSLHPLQLQTMLEQSQELVRGGEVGCVVAADVSTLGERGEGIDGAQHTESFVGAAVHELQQLDGELDVAQTSASELDLPLP